MGYGYRQRKTPRLTLALTPPPPTQRPEKIRERARGWRTGQLCDVTHSLTIYGGRHTTRHTNHHAASTGTSPSTSLTHSLAHTRLCVFLFLDLV